MDKRGVVSISTFSFIITILLLLLGFIFYYYTSTQEEINIIVKETELSNSINSFRSVIVNIVFENNSYLNYSNNLDSDEIIFYVNQSYITGNVYYKENLVTKTYFLYGITFCDNYTFSPVINNEFYYNGSCITLITE